MRISVAMASFNGEKYIYEQIQSIMRQTRLPDEIVISDDHSTDHTVSEIKKAISDYSSESVCFVLLSNDGEQGVRSNFENALSHTTGDLVFLCDQDDIWLENKIEIMSEVMSARDEMVAVHNAKILQAEADESTLNDKELDRLPMSEEILTKCGKFSGEKNLLLSMLGRIPARGMCLCVKQEYLQSIMPMSKAAYHDTWIEFCAIADDTMVFVPQTLAYFRVHERNVEGLQNNVNPEKRKTKESLSSKQEKALLEQDFIWGNDTINYLKEKGYDSRAGYMIYQSRVGFRIDIISANRITAVLKMRSGRVRKQYKNVRKDSFNYDFQFVLNHSREYRREYINNLNKMLRRVIYF